MPPAKSSDNPDRAVHARVLLKADPLNDISAVRRVSRVMLNGAWLKGQ